MGARRLPRAGSNSNFWSPGVYQQPHRLRSITDGGGGGGIVPVDPTTLSNEFFFRGDQFTGTTAAVDTLVDLSSNGRNAALVAGTKWTQNATDAGINNQGSISMNGSGYYRFLADGTNLIGTVNQAFYLYGVMRVATSLASPMWWLAVGWFGDSLVCTFTNAMPTYARVNIGLSSAAAPAAIGDVTFIPATDTWFTFIMEYNGGGSATTAANWSLYYNGTTQYTPAALAGLGIANVRNWVGARPGGTVPSTGRIGELGLVKGSTNAALRSGLASYWNTRYGFANPVSFTVPEDQAIETQEVEPKIFAVPEIPKPAPKVFPWKKVAIGAAAAAAIGTAVAIYLL